MLVTQLCIPFCWSNPASTSSNQDMAPPQFQNLSISMLTALVLKVVSLSSIENPQPHLQNSLLIRFGSSDVKITTTLYLNPKIFLSYCNRNLKSTFKINSWLVYSDESRSTIQSLLIRGPQCFTTTSHVSHPWHLLTPHYCTVLVPLENWITTVEFQDSLCCGEYSFWHSKTLQGLLDSQF